MKCFIIRKVLTRSVDYYGDIFSISFKLVETVGFSVQDFWEQSTKMVEKLLSFLDFLVDGVLLSIVQGVLYYFDDLNCNYTDGNMQLNVCFWGMYQISKYASK